MSRRAAEQRIDRLCRLHHMNKDMAFEIGQKALKSYPELCWKTAEEARDVRDDLMYYHSNDVDGAMVDVVVFASSERRNYYYDKIEELFTYREQAALIDLAAAWVRDYTVEGPVYYDILCQWYLYRGKTKETEILRMLNMERSTFFCKKKEAITVFGIALCDAIKRYADEIKANRREAALHPREAVEELPFY